MHILFCKKLLITLRYSLTKHANFWLGVQNPLTSNEMDCVELQQRVIYILASQHNTMLVWTTLNHSDLQVFMLLQYETKNLWCIYTYVNIMKIIQGITKISSSAIKRNICTWLLISLSMRLLTGIIAFGPNVWKREKYNDFKNKNDGLYIFNYLNT